jgi:hypothetical protein
MGKLLVGVTRFLLFWAVGLLLTGVLAHVLC